MSWALFQITAVLFRCRTFETSLLLDESISDELPYSGELYLNIPKLSVIMIL